MDLWHTDSLKFFLHMKFLSNEVKGNFLREKAKGLIAALRLRLDPIFEHFCAYLHSELESHYSGAQLSLQQQIEKEAMLQVFEIRIGDDTGVDSVTIIKLLDQEIQKPK